MAMPTNQAKQKAAAPPAAAPPATDPPATETMSAEDEIRGIEDLRKNMVSREDFEKVCDDRDKFRTALLNGGSLDQEEERPERKELIKKLSECDSGSITNLEYIKTTLQLRDAALEETGIDPFECAESPDGFGERVAEGLKKMVEEAGDRPEAFLGIYQAGVRDEKVQRK